MIPNDIAQRVRASLRVGLVFFVALVGAVSSRAQTPPDWLWQLHTHERSVWSLVYSPDGDHLFTSGADGQVRRWNLATGEITMRYRAISEIIRVAASDDGALIAATTNSKLLVWNVETGAQLCNLSLGTAGMGLRFLPGQNNLLVATYNNAHLYEIDPYTGQVIRADPLPSAAWDMDISADGSIAIPFPQGSGGMVRIYDLTTRALKWARSIGDAPYYVDLSPDGQMVAVGTDAPDVRAYATENLVQLATLPTAFTGIGVPQFSNDGEVLFTLRRPVYGYRTSDWQKIHDFYPDSPPDAMATHPSDGTVALAHSDSIRIYAGAGMSETGRLGPVRGVVTRWASRRDDSQYATSHRDGYRYFAAANLWQPDAGMWLSGINYTNSAQDLYGIDYSSDGSSIAISNYLNTSSGRVIRVFDVASGAMALEVPNVHTDTVNDLRYSPDGSLIATVSSDKSAKVWNAQDGALVVTLLGHTSGIGRCFFRGNAELITVSGIGREVIHWNLATGQPSRSWSFNDTIQARYVASSDQLFASVGYALTCQQINIATGNVVNTIAFPGWLAAVSRDGTTLLSSGPTMGFLDASTGMTLASLDNGAEAMEFTNDGSRVFTRDGVIDNPVQDEYAATEMEFLPPVNVVSGSLSSTVVPRDNLWLRLAALSSSARTSLPVEFSANVSTDNVRLVRARMKCKASSAGSWRLTLQLFDNVSGTWSNQARTASQLTTTPVELTVSSNVDPSRYVGPDGRVRLRMIEQSVSIPSRGRPDVSIDYLRFEIVR